MCGTRRQVVHFNVDELHEDQPKEVAHVQQHQHQKHCLQEVGQHQYKLNFVVVVHLVQGELDVCLDEMLVSRADVVSHEGNPLFHV